MVFLAALVLVLLVGMSLRHVVAVVAYTLVVVDVDVVVRGEEVGALHRYFVQVSEALERDDSSVPAELKDVSLGGSALVCGTRARRGPPQRAGCHR